MRLAGVPISVVMPPRIVAKASGMSVAAGGRRAERAISVAIGIVMTSAAMLFMNADRIAATSSSTESLSKKGELDGMAILATVAATPESSTALPTTSTAATAITAGSANPAKAAAGRVRPVATQASRARSATRSCRTRSETKRMSVANKIAADNAAGVIARIYLSKIAHASDRFERRSAGAFNASFRADGAQLHGPTSPRASKMLPSPAGLVPECITTAALAS